MSQIISNSIYGHQLLDIVNPIKDMNASDIIEKDYKISHVDMGPSTLEGDVYHADFSVHALIERA